MNIGFLITARLKSKRLPLKILKKIGHKALIHFMVDRIKQSKNINKIIVCTSNLKQDNDLVNLCKKKTIDYFCGDPEDVLKRLYDAAIFYKLDYIVNITADCPLVEPEYIDLIVKKYKKKKFDLIRAFDLPHGSFSYGIKVSALKKILDIKLKKDTEVWERYFTHSGLFRIHDLKVKKKHTYPGLRMTVDYYEDLLLIRKIYKYLKTKSFFSLSDIINLFKKKPGLLKINDKCGKKFIKKYNSESKIRFNKKIKRKFAVYRTFSDHIMKNNYKKTKIINLK